MNQELEALKTVFMSGYRSLQNFEFNFFNPLFWAIIFLLFLILWKFWSGKRAFSFSFMTALILLSITEIEFRFSALFSKAGETFDSSIIRLLGLAAIALIFLFYTFFK
jgi:hypothetical protein